MQCHCPYTVRKLFATLLKHAFGESTKGIYLQTRSDGNLFKLSKLIAKTRVHGKYVHDLIFADDVAIKIHTPEDLKRLLDHFVMLAGTLDLHQPGRNAGHGARH